MPSDCGQRTIGQFALVSYIAGELGAFLDSLRIELTPNCNPRAHVTILPPRQIEPDIALCAKQVVEETSVTAPFRVEIGEVEVFQKSNVIYLALTAGVRELRDLHAHLNRGPLAFECTFNYHPHITLAQDITEEESRHLAEVAKSRWDAYTGPRDFVVEFLSLVQNVDGRWHDLADNRLAEAVEAGS